MKVAVVGLRGIPNIMGGIESHCQNLYPRMVKQGYYITILGRTPYLHEPEYDYDGVKVKGVWAFKSKFLETFLHTFVAIIYAGIVLRPDVVHIHAIGPALFTPLARLFGLRVVVTHHGADYDRQKWNRFAKTILKAGELMGIKFANSIIVVGRSLTSKLKLKYPKCSEKIQFIPNGTLVGFSDNVTEQDLPSDLGLVPENYILAVARLVPEKGIHDLIEAFKLSNTALKLVIVGDADHGDEYSQKIKSSANQNIVIAGRRNGAALSSLYKYCGLFVLPSYHEGHPIVALEAISAGSRVLLSDILPNKDIDLQNDCYFPVGDITSLANKITNLPPLNLSVDKATFLAKYDWNSIATETMKAYSTVVRSEG
ncbi:glycosyltransferase family 4 protein [Alteromonas sp.]|jgi:glycosyltransferase involved in cell wall biosynthesis|uniref:glycosyltransferase family 4 protein n=1 Tax=Alteromonas sp. TaxID=232 RepID=UPI0032D8F0B0